MHFSCKLTSTLILALDNKGEELGHLLAQSSLPEEFLRDPSFWIEASELERWLEQFMELRGSKDPQILREMAVRCAELRSWGVFDSVLRMMSDTQGVYHQPERLLSYFIAPAPPVGEVERGSQFVKFHLPVSSKQYPLAAEMLKASIEMIPVFAGKPRSHCEWNDFSMEVRWGDQVEAVASPLSAEGDRLSPVAALDLEEIRHHVARLSDYMVRAQQVITLLSTHQKHDKQVREALRRVDWEIVQNQFPLTVENCFQIFRRSVPPDQISK